MVMVPKRVEVLVVGHVQGIFFRQTAKEQAEKLNLTGWARNEADGSVHIVAEGEKEDLQKLIDWAKVGTKWSQVERVDVEWEEATRGFKDFKIL